MSDRMMKVSCQAQAQRVSKAVATMSEGRGFRCGLEGQTFGDLRVLRRAGSTAGLSRTRALWVCACTCGGLTERTTHALRLPGVHRCLACGARAKREEGRRAWQARHPAGAHA
jgi:hypothetical protein